MAENICDGLIKVDPANEEYYVNKKQEYLPKLGDLNKDERSKRI